MSKPTRDDLISWLTRSAVYSRGYYSQVASEMLAMQRQIDSPIPMVLHCPECRTRHIDAGEFATKPHHTHACQACGLVWRPAIVPTVGVRFLPGFKDEESKA